MRPQDATGWPIFEGSRVTVYPKRHGLKRYTAVVAYIDPRNTGPLIKVQCTRGAQLTHWVRPEWCVVQRQAPKTLKPRPVPTQAQAYQNPFPPDKGE